ncbi:MAG: J domain-containing protein [Polyangiales bacterium]
MAQLDELDYYALLGVAPDATIDAIKAGFRDFARRYHPDRFAGDTQRTADATRVYVRATEAYRVLLHPEQRRVYDESLREGQLRLGPQSNRRSQRPVSGTPQGDAVHARARPFLARAEQALASGDRKQARLNLKIALQHDPGSVLLREKLAEIEASLKPPSP